MIRRRSGVERALASLMLALLPAGAFAQPADLPIAVTRFQGNSVPAVIVSDRSGNSLRLSDLRGRIIIVNM